MKGKTEQHQGKSEFQWGMHADPLFSDGFLLRRPIRARLRRLAAKLLEKSGANRSSFPITR
jgi:hypothetical protein